MQSNRSQQSSSNHSKITNNFELQKSKIYNTRPNPQEIDANQQIQSHRYDIITQPSLKQKYQFRRSERDKYEKDNQKQRGGVNSYRVRKSYGSSSRSQNGRTVYEIVNVRRNRDTQEEYSLTSKSQVMNINSNLKGSILQNDKKLTQPQPQFFISKQYEHKNKITPCFNYSNIYPKTQPLFLQKQWNMNQVYPSSQPASILKQQPPKQSPLNPSKPEILSELLKRNVQINLYKIPEQEHQQNNLNNNIGKFNRKQDILYQKELIDKLNMRTKYYRFKHQQKIKQKLEGRAYQGNRNNRQKMGHLGYNNLYVSKVPSIQKLDQIQVKYGDPIQKLIKLLHHQNKNRLKLTIKIPTFFHNIPDILLPDSQLKFKAIMIFEQYGIMKSKLIGQNNNNKDVKIIKCSESITFIYYDEVQGGKYCVNWYQDGSVYMGQMHGDVREGIGLQWVPGVYVYYGQYNDNMRHGYGIIKYNNMQVYIGVWAYDCYHGYGKLIDPEGWVVQQGVFRNSEIIRSAFFHQLD